MIKIIKRGGFREQAARHLKYKDSVNQRSNIDPVLIEPSIKNPSVVKTTVHIENEAAKIEQELSESTLSRV